MYSRTNVRDEVTADVEAANLADEQRRESVLDRVNKPEEQPVLGSDSQTNSRKHILRGIPDNMIHTGSSSLSFCLLAVFPTRKHPPYLMVDDAVPGDRGRTLRKTVESLRMWRFRVWHSTLTGKRPDTDSGPHGVAGA